MITCIRCGKKTNTHTMSYFNTDEICMDCKKDEKNHVLYEKARKVELEQVRNGNFNYGGVFENLSWEKIKTKTTL